MDANLDMQRRLPWKEIIGNGSLESYTPRFTEVMLWTNIRWAPMGKYKRLQLTLPLKKFTRCTAGEE